MRPRALLALIAAALLALIAAVAVEHAASQRRQPGMAGTRLLPGLESSINAVTGLQLLGAGAHLLVTLQRTAQGWAVTQTAAPADPARVRSYLLRLARARIIAAKTRDPSLYATIGVAAIASASAGDGGVELRLQGMTASPALLIGRYDERLDGTFVRPADSAESLLVAGDLTPPQAPVDWMPHPLLSIASDAVQAVTVSDASGARYVVAREADGRLMVRHAPAGVQAAARRDLVAGVLDGLDYVAVEPAAKPPADALRARVELRNGVVIELHLWRPTPVATHARAVLTVQAPRGAAPALVTRAAVLAAWLQGRTWVLAPGTWSLLSGSLQPGMPMPASAASAPAAATSSAAAPPMISGGDRG
ncbi:MAG TPA: DUF4340 domain-containing protein [Rhodanobacteraceae bacterium]|nr:DUF4340 domain-containing protein [Rhodanobacteraceae bacterium]